MRHNGPGALTLEDARTWIEETGLCHFLPRRQFSSSLAPSFVEAVAGQRHNTPDQKQIALAEELLVRLENEGVALRLNLLGQPGEQPDYVVAAWVLPYVYALRGDRDWRRSPQLTGSRQVSPLAIQAYKRLEAGDATVSELRQFLGREVSEAAVLRAITELWQQLRIVPVFSAAGQPAKWQLLRHRFQKAIAEGASTSQVTAISVLASIFLQAVIASSMEEVEVFLSPLTARSKIREVVRGLVATRQVHTLTMGHAPHFYVAGTLPQFSIAPTAYGSASMLGANYSSYFHHREESLPEPAVARHAPAEHAEPAAAAAHEHTGNGAAPHQPAAAAGPAEARPHLGRHNGAHARDRKPNQSAGAARPIRRGSDARPAAGRPANGRPGSARPASARPASARPGSARPASARPGSARTAATRPGAAGSRPASASRWNGAKPGSAARNGNGNHGTTAAGKNGRPTLNGRTNGNGHSGSNGHSNGNGHSGANGHANGNGHASHASNGARGANKAAPAWGKRNGARPAGSKTASSSRSAASARGEARTESRPSRGARKPTVAAGAKRYSYAGKPGTKKRG